MNDTQSNQGFFNTLKRLLGTTTIIGEAAMTVKKRNILKISAIFLLVFFIGSVLSNFLFGLPTTFYLMSDADFMQAFNDSSASSATVNQLLNDKINGMPLWVQSLSLIATIGAAVIAIGYCTKYERRRLFTLGVVRKDAIKEILLGSGVGAAVFGLIYGAMLLSGEVSFNGLSSNVSCFAVVMFIIGYIIQAYSVEIIFRGYYFVSAATAGNIPLAVFGSAVIYSIFNLSNGVGFINMLLYGLLSALYVLRRGSIWGIASLNAIYHILQNTVFGYPVSGSASASIFSTAVQKSSIISGGDLGPDGSIILTLVLTLGIGILLLVKNKDVYPEIDFSKEFHSAF